MGENICKIMSIAGFEGKKPVYEEIGRMLCNGYWLKSYEENYMQSKVTLEFTSDYCYAAFRTVPETANIPVANHDLIGRIEALERKLKPSPFAWKWDGDIMGILRTRSMTKEEFNAEYGK